MKRLDYADFSPQPDDEEGRDWRSITSGKRRIDRIDEAMLASAQTGQPLRHVMAEMGLLSDQRHDQNQTEHHSP